mmetsp:Transcript_23109/g.72091  ORF Transcript_23109/g.72091 Transcript_23109/m.72091 type:complete len:374 (-) Transcript_23109:4996-6117(-)
MCAPNHVKIYLVVGRRRLADDESILELGLLEQPHGLGAPNLSRALPVVGELEALHYHRGDARGVTRDRHAHRVGEGGEASELSAPLPPAPASRGIERLVPGPHGQTLPASVRGVACESAEVLILRPNEAVVLAQLHQLWRVLLGVEPEAAALRPRRDVVDKMIVGMRDPEDRGRLIRDEERQAPLCQHSEVAPKGVPGLHRVLEEVHMPHDVVGHVVFDFHVMRAVHGQSAVEGAPESATADQGVRLSAGQVKMKGVLSHREGLAHISEENVLEDGPRRIEKHDVTPELGRRVKAPRTRAHEVTRVVAGYFNVARQPAHRPAHVNLPTGVPLPRRRHGMLHTRMRVLQRDVERDCLPVPAERHDLADLPMVRI